MSRRTGSLGNEYFERLYDENPDPWGFAESPYEREKYAHTLSVLAPRYAAALEVGCSIGVLTAQLAPRCGRLLSLEPAARALQLARERNAAHAQVEFRQARVPEQWPEGRFDLILLSEVLYYLHESDLRRVADQAAAALNPGGELLLVHWTGETDYPLSGDAAVTQFVAALPPALKLRTVLAERRPQYRLDLLRHTG